METTTINVPAFIDDRRIRAVTLTGSVGAGSAVAEAAGRNIKKSVLELGGTDVFVVMPSADIARSAEFGANSRTQNSGQSCICAKRFYIHDDVYDEWFAAFTARMAAMTPGDPFDAGTSFGPMATPSVRAEAHDSPPLSTIHDSCSRSRKRVASAGVFSVWFRRELLTALTRLSDSGM